MQVEIEKHERHWLFGVSLLVVWLIFFDLGLVDWIEQTGLGFGVQFILGIGASVLIGLGIGHLWLRAKLWWKMRSAR